jgi:hypothetical protein
MSPDIENERAQLPVLALNVTAAAQAASVSRSAIFAALNDGTLCGRKAGKALLIEVAELERWLQSLPFRGRKPIGFDSAADPPKPARVYRNRLGKKQASTSSTTETSEASL